MYVYIDPAAHATYYATLAEAQAAWLAGRGEGQIAQVLNVSVVVASAGRAQAARNALIAEAARNGTPAIEIAAAEGLTRERVRQILVREGAPTQQPLKHPPRPCAHCGATFAPRVAVARYCSRTCAGLARRQVHADDREKRCPACGETKPIDAFSIRAGGYPVSWCKACVAAKARAYAAKKREARAAG